MAAGSCERAVGSRTRPRVWPALPAHGGRPWRGRPGAGNRGRPGGSGWRGWVMAIWFWLPQVED